MNFLFVDQILESIPGKRIVGLKHVTPADTYLEMSVENKPCLVVAIIGEALGQLGAWNVMALNEFTRRPVAGVVGEVKILGNAYVGDTILLETDIQSVDEQAIHYHSVASVNGKPIFKLKNALGPFLPMENFIDPKQVAIQYDMINRPASQPEILESRLIPNINPNKFHYVGFDSIVSWEKGKEIVAEKKVSIIEPFFEDHFPRMPVLPLTILLQSKVNLARMFLKDYLGEEKASRYDGHILRRIKMNDFVRPGTILQTTMTLHNESDDKFVFRFSSFVNGKRVCIMEATFIEISKR